MGVREADMGGQLRTKSYFVLHLISIGMWRGFLRKELSK